MLSIVIIGTGNVASHLLEAFLSKETITVVQMIGRSKDALSYFEGKVPTSIGFSNVVDADLYHLAISDDAIPEVSEHLNAKRGLVAHTSGSVPLKSLGTKRCGVFYPLQTFTKGQSLVMENVPICLEAENKEDMALLQIVASSISEKVYEINSEQRQHLHLAAVFANNFSNHLYYLAHEICTEQDIPFQILKPLIKETANKIQHVLPLEAQTGPARRNDRRTLKRHLSLLENKNHQKLYNILSESIQNTYGKEL